MIDQEPSFTAEVASPRRSVLFLYRTGIERSSLGSLPWLGWALIVYDVGANGQAGQVTDYWVETLLEAMGYENMYSDKPLAWRWDPSGEPADLRELQPTFDASKRFATASETIASPTGEQRLCFNLYDDGFYRYTLEEVMRSKDLTVWVPKKWSEPHPDLATAKAAARTASHWFA